MDYTQLTDRQREEMLATIGVASVDDLFTAIPEAQRLTGLLDLPKARSELELQRDIAKLAGRNVGTDQLACFMGAGAYDHFIPTLIDHFTSRGEFLTAYTPYQAEASQGALQAFFEFQTQIARLTGMDISNASLYDGATAVVEAIHLALTHTRKRRVLVAETLLPEYRRVVRTCLSDLPVEYVAIPACAETGMTDVEALLSLIDDDTACVVVGSPNMFGLIEDWSACFAVAHEAAKTQAIAVFNPIACALLKASGACGADIAVGEGQPLGIPLQFGGPYLGLFAATKNLIRKMPGRLIGQTVDADGRRSFCLTLQTREQHIKGERATSNVCTNQGLMALRATMYMSTLGAGGLREVAEQCYHKAHYLAERITALPGYSLKYPAGAFFHEFAVTCPKSAAEVIAAGRVRGLLPGVPLCDPQLDGAGGPNDLLIAVTEKRTKAEMDDLVDVLAAIG
ncbi:MAG: aminomethyl-transferring glycine dehydrogenase subunit GcvPA [Phycisphaerales bacterium]|nr:aminomethyl-transferring glycine dehydrogenase subunit GcvPA [Phycisphaerales bacterium]